MKETTWETEDGERNEMAISSFINKIENDYNKLKDDIRTSFQE